MKKKFKLIDLDCANCAAKMEEATKKTAGVKNANVNFMLLKMTVDFEDGADSLAKFVIGEDQRPVTAEDGFYSIEELESKYSRTNMLIILDYGCGRFGTLKDNGTVGYVDIDYQEKAVSKELTFEEFALKWAKDTIKKYEN